jgi:general secretion pathway protein D
MTGVRGQAPATPAPAQPAAPAPQGTPVGIRLNFTDAALADVIKLLANELKLNYVQDASISHAGSVTINTFGEVRDTDLRQVLETILRMNNLAMVQVGNLYRIVQANNVSRQPVEPVSQSDSSKFPDDEHLVLNLVFLRFMNSSEMEKILEPYAGEGAKITSYDPANLLLILDNSRNMRRTLDLINMFDSEAFAGQRVRAYELKNGRPTDVKKELDEVFKAYSLSAGTKATGGAVQFVALDRINTILAVAPNPGVFTSVETWLAKLDIPSKITVGSVENNVYKLKYGRAEVLGAVVRQLYGLPGGSSFGGPGGLYGGTTGYTGFSTSSAVNGGLSSSAISMFGNSAGGSSGFAGAQNNSQNVTAAAQQAPVQTPFNMGTAPTGSATAQTSGAAPGTGTTDQTGTYLTGASGAADLNGRPRIVANPFDNTLLVQSTHEQWAQISNLLEKIDVSPRQVLIEAKIYEVDLTGELTAGVEAFLQKNGATNSAGLTQQQLTGSSAPNSTGTGLTLSAGTLVGQARQLLATLQANELRTKSKVLSSPTLIATDSIPASITVGDTVPTLSSQGVNPGVTAAGSSLFTNTISNVSTGTGLNILARVNPSGVVTMVIDQSVTAPTPTTTSSINSPSFSQREVSTQVTVDDGDMIAIGGIINDTTNETVTGIPYLDRIPYLGFLFGTKSTSTVRTELIIFLTPHVIYDTHHISDATQELKDQMKGLRKVIKDNP